MIWGLDSWFNHLKYATCSSREKKKKKKKARRDLPKVITVFPWILWMARLEWSTRKKSSFLRHRHGVIANGLIWTACYVSLYNKVAKMKLKVSCLACARMTWFKMQGSVLHRNVRWPWVFFWCKNRIFLRIVQEIIILK